MNRLLLLLAAAVAVAGGVLSLIKASGIVDVSALSGLAEPAEVTVSGHLESVNITSRYVVLVLAGGGFKITAVADRNTVEALYGPITPRNFESTVVVRGLYIPANRTLVVESILRGCHSAYSQTAANVNT
jgi:hypothetical protein